MVIVDGNRWIGAWRKPELEGSQDKWQVVYMVDLCHSGLDDVRDWDVVKWVDEGVLVAILP